MKNQAETHFLDLVSPEVIDELEAHVQNQLGPRVRDFRLAVEDGQVVLHGRARTYYAKQLAQHVVMDLTDLPILRNDVEVD